MTMRNGKARFFSENSQAIVMRKTIPKTDYQATAGRSQSKIKDPTWLKALPDLTKARDPPLT